MKKPDPLKYITAICKYEFQKDSKDVVSNVTFVNEHTTHIVIKVKNISHFNIHTLTNLEWFLGLVTDIKKAYIRFDLTHFHVCCKSNTVSLIFMATFNAFHGAFASETLKEWLGEEHV